MDRGTLFLTWTTASSVIHSHNHLTWSALDLEKKKFAAESIWILGNLKILTELWAVFYVHFFKLCRLFICEFVLLYFSFFCTSFTIRGSLLFTLVVSSLTLTLAWSSPPVRISVSVCAYSHFTFTFQLQLLKAHIKKLFFPLLTWIVCYSFSAGPWPWPQPLLTLCPDTPWCLYCKVTETFCRFSVEKIFFCRAKIKMMIFKFSRLFISDPNYGTGWWKQLWHQSVEKTLFPRCVLLLIIGKKGPCSSTSTWI